MALPAVALLALALGAAGLPATQLVANTEPPALVFGGEGLSPPPSVYLADAQGGVATDPAVAEITARLVPDDDGAEVLNGVRETDGGLAVFDGIAVRGVRGQEYRFEYTSTAPGVAPLLSAPFVVAPCEDEGASPEEGDPLSCRCAPGYGAGPDDPAIGRCSPCPVGYYNARDLVNAVCIRCPPGVTTLEDRSVSVDDCACLVNATTTGSPCVYVQESVSVAGGDFERTAGDLQLLIPEGAFDGERVLEVEVTEGEFDPEQYLPASRFVTLRLEPALDTLAEPVRVAIAASTQVTGRFKVFQLDPESGAWEAARGGAVDRDANIVSADLTRLGDVVVFQILIPVEKGNLGEVLLIALSISGAALCILAGSAYYARRHRSRAREQLLEESVQGSERVRKMTSDSGVLPPYWREERSVTGELYFANQATGETRWEKPTTK